MLASTYLQAKATCDQVSALDAILDKELMLETMQQVREIFGSFGLFCVSTLTQLRLTFCTTLNLSKFSSDLQFELNCFEFFRAQVFYVNLSLTIH